MTEPRREPRNRSELLAAIAQSWGACVDLIDGLADEQWTARTDQRGWTVKDHVAQVAAWENVVTEVFRVGAPQYVTFRMTEAEWAAGGAARADAVIHARTAGQSLRRVRNNRDVTHARIVSMLGGLSDADLARPLSDFGAVDADGSVLVEMAALLIDRYDALCAAITALVDEEECGPTETTVAAP